jgi:hypothetical protein
MTNATTNNPPWEIRTQMSLHTGRFVGYTVQRIHNPYTPQARAEILENGRVFETESDAMDAIARAIA